MITVAVMHTHKAGASKEEHSKCLQTARIQACWLLSHLWILKGSSDNDYKYCVWILHGGKIQSTSPAKRQESTKYIQHTVNTGSHSETWYRPASWDTINSQYFKIGERSQALVDRSYLNRSMVLRVCVVGGCPRGVYLTMTTLQRSGLRWVLNGLGLSDQSMPTGVSTCQIYNTVSCRWGTRLQTMLSLHYTLPAT